jgi:hypothetical protein
MDSSLISIDAFCQPTRDMTVICRYDDIPL